MDLNNAFFTDAVYKRVIKIVKQFVLNNSGNEDDVDDVLQEGIAIFFQKLNSSNFCLVTEPELYIFSICRKKWLTELQRRKKLVLVDNFGDIKDESNLLRLAKERKEVFIDLIHKHITSLGPKCQEFFAHKLKGLSGEQIAELMCYKGSNNAKDKNYRCKRRLFEVITSDPEYIQLMNDD